MGGEKLIWGIGSEKFQKNAKEFIRGAGEGSTGLN